MINKNSVNITASCSTIFKLHAGCCEISLGRLIQDFILTRLNKYDEGEIIQQSASKVHFKDFLS